MVDNEPGRVPYARVTEGMAAGTVAVDVVGSREHSTQVSVTYDLTALTHAGENWLEASDADYDAATGDSATEIAAALRGAGRRDS
jgi:hypothetical protein